MRSRFSFPGDEILKNCWQIKLQLTRGNGKLALYYEIHGQVNDILEGEDEDEGDLLEQANTDAVRMALELIGALESQGKGGVRDE